MLVSEEASGFRLADSAALVTVDSNVRSAVVSLAGEGSSVIHSIVSAMQA